MQRPGGADSHSANNSRVHGGTKNGLSAQQEHNGDNTRAHEVRNGP